MPSGAKKRKAAKKKKEQKANDSNNSNSSSINSQDPQGNEDPKSQDERDSDSGEVSSRVAQEHNKDQHNFGRANEEPDEAASSSVQSAFPENIVGVTGKAGGKKVEPKNDDRLSTERELKSKQDSDNKIVAKKSHGEDDRSSSSSSSSSDEDTESVENKWKEQACSVDSLSGQVTQISENGKPVKDDSVMETAPDVVRDEPPVPMSEVAKDAAESSQVANPEVLEVIEPELKANEVKLSASNEATDTSTGTIASGKEEDKAPPVFSEKSSDAVSITTCGIENKKFTSSDAHPSEALNNDTNIKYSDTSESVENRPLIASTPRVSQRTSWTSCCGLFEAFTGSGR